MKVENSSLLEKTKIYLEQLKQRAPYNFTIYLVMLVVGAMILIRKRI